MDYELWTCGLWADDYGLCERLLFRAAGEAPL